MKRIILSEAKLRRLLYEYNQTKFTPTIMDMDKEFRTLNTLLFNDILPIPRFIPTNDQQQFGLFKCQIANNGRISNPTIYISVYYQYDIQEFDSLIAHEMIHYYLAYIGHDTNCTHNAEWQQMASDINQDYGLNITETIDSSQYNPSQQPNGGGNAQPNPQQGGNGQQPNGGSNPQLWTQLKQIRKNLIDLYKRSEKEQKHLEANSKNQPKMAYASQDLINLCPMIAKRIAVCVKHQTLNENTGKGLQGVTNVFGLNGGLKGFKHEWEHNYDKWNRLLWGKDKFKCHDENGNEIEVNATLYQLVFNVYPNIKAKYAKYSQSLDMNVPTLPHITTEIDGLKQLMEQELGQNQQSPQNGQQPNPNGNGQQPNPNGNPQPQPNGNGQQPPQNG